MFVGSSNGMTSLSTTFIVPCGAGLESIERYSELRVASVTCGPGPCRPTGCPQNGQSRFDMSCTTALPFLSQDHLA